MLLRNQRQWSPPAAAPVPHPKPAPPPTPVDEISLEGVEEIVGVPITPKYLPAGYRFQRGFVHYWHSEGFPQRAYADLNLYFSDEEITGKVETLRDFDSLRHKKIMLAVSQVVKMPCPDFPEVRARQAEEWGCTRIDASEVKGRLPANTVSVVDINQVKAYLSVGEARYGLQWCWPGLVFDMSMLKELPVEGIIKIAESMG